jgi:Cdc6-like AAA superfamily ATPase
MPYVQDHSIFRRLIDDAVSDQDLRQKLEAAEVGRGKLEAFLTSREPEIWASAGHLIVAYNDAEKKAATLELEYKAIQNEKPFVLTLVENILPPIGGLLFLAAFSLFSGTVRHLLIVYLKTRPLGVLVAVAASVLILAVVVWRRYRRVAPAYEARLQAAKDAFESALAELPKSKDLIEPTVTLSIVGNIRELIDQVVRAPFRPDLPEADTRGLSEVHNKEFEIITDARRYVRGLIEKMSGGSVGVAGPRGCGKTTLLTSFWQDGQVDAKTLSVFATAPVHYDAREFLLHLFTSLCSQVIANETETEIPTVWNQMDELRKIPSPRMVDISVLGSVSLIAALILLFAGFVIAVAGAGATRPASTTTTATPKSTPPPAAKPQDADKESSPLGPPAVPYFVWGAVALAIGIGARLSPSQPKPTGLLDFYFGPWIHESARTKAQEEQDSKAKADPIAALLQRAQRTLLGLRFQQSYSSGWSGTLKLPIGLEGGANAAVSFAESQLSLPEIVSEYRKFLQDAIKKRYNRILIVIDELDKLASDEEAKTFLNSIKAVFGEESVYYLISISENAMSSFERRGLPIRDEFDSSFDDAVYIPYLDFDGSRHLLAQRIPEPPPDVYRAFCHILSGGLPRDLIRNCRKLYDYRRENQTKDNTVAETCPAIVRRDIKAKLEAIRHNLQRVPDEEKTAEILAILAVDEWNRETLAEAILKLGIYQSGLMGMPGPDKKNELALANILEEIKAYLWFSLAVMTTFASITSAAVYDDLHQRKVFERLASARQWMAVNRAAAIGTVAQIVSLPLVAPQDPGKPPVPASGVVPEAPAGH